MPPLRDLLVQLTKRLKPASMVRPWKRYNTHSYYLQPVFRVSVSSYSAHYLGVTRSPHTAPVTVWPTSWVCDPAWGSKCVLTPSSFCRWESRNCSSQGEDSWGGHQLLELICCGRWESWYSFQWGQHLTYVTSKHASLEKFQKYTYQNYENVRHQQRNIAVAQTWVEGAQMGARIQHVDDFGITCKAGSPPPFPRRAGEQLQWLSQTNPAQKHSMALNLWHHSHSFLLAETAQCLKHAGLVVYHCSWHECCL